MRPPESFNRALRMKNMLYEKSYPTLIKNIEEETVDAVYFSRDYESVIVSNKNKFDDPYVDYSIVKIAPPVTNSLVELSVQHHVEPIFLLPPQPNPVQMASLQILDAIGTYFVPIVFLSLFINLIRSFFQGSSRGGQSGGSFLSNLPGLPGLPQLDFKNDKLRLQKANISLASFAGSPEVLEECTEVVSYLKNATAYKLAGAEIPRGILLEGPPGTGKTLLAKSIASEADANFVSISASEFVEVFVGVGASKIRALFKQARENKPCILFIDEIDSVGKQRSSGGVNVGNDEREQTLNQLLAEMDGFADNDGILVIAATNRKDILDKALLRPGRFDRIISVALPDKVSRRAIYQVHAKTKTMDPDVNADLIAEYTSGFSGAEIKNMVNEAAIFAVRNQRSQIQEIDLLNAIEKAVVGLIRKVDIRAEDTRRRVAIHELGHAICCAQFPEYFDLKKVTIQSTYSGAGGYTLFNEHANITDGGMFTKDIFMKRLIVTMGGKAAERIYYGEEYVSLGAIQDLKQANNLAVRMIEQYGMGDQLETFYRDAEQNKIELSEITRTMIDAESMVLVQDAYETAICILTNSSARIDPLIDRLLNETTLYNL
jgi:cell division protease FtsH